MKLEILKLKFMILLVLGIFFVSGCLAQLNQPNIFPIYSGNQQVINQIIDKYNISSYHIEAAQAKEFILDGEKVYLVHIEYGAANDCPSGCFFSHICTIVEGTIDYPYSFIFTNIGEDILNIDEEPKFRMGYSSDYYGQEKISGLTHRLVETEEFKNFKDESIGTNEFRWCFI